jgi:predicted  nucleic acid-binding Zn-ribbon protein
MTPAKLAQVSARAPISPAAFLDQLAADAGHQHLRRLSELRVELEAQVVPLRDASLHPALEALAHALPSLDFSLLKDQGLWASLTGRNKNAGAGFVAQFEQIDEGAMALPTLAAAVQKAQRSHASTCDRALVELEVEYRALDKIIDQGARWLQDMRNQLKAREAQAGEDESVQAQIQADSARCETLVARLKLLRAVVGAAQQVHQNAHTAAERRNAFHAAVQAVLGSELKEWRSRLGTLAGAAREGKVSGLNLAGPKDVHKQLSRELEKLLGESEQLASQEEALEHSLAELGEQLSAAG